DNQSVTVVNWEKLRSKDKKTGEWKNTLMKDAEYNNFRDVMRNTKAEGIKIIGIIDESHIGAGAVRTSELREIIDADVWVEVSATPKSYDSMKLKEIQANDDSPHKIDRKTHYIFIRPQEVIAEEMIKRAVIVNVGIKDYDLEQEDSQTLVLHAAFDKRLALKKAYQDEGTNINPLVLIQIENAEAGSNTMEYVYHYLLNDKDVSKDKIAIWLSGIKSESIKNISENDNELEFLIFKQAIDTGWDCPRAQILVKFREIKSEIFATQVLGRILRMPEQKYYTNDDLNVAYIYTNLQKFDDDDKTGLGGNILKPLQSQRITTYKSLLLRSFYKKRTDFGDLTSSFYEILEQVFCNHFGLEFKPTVINMADNEAILNKKGIDLSSTQRLDWLYDETKITILDIDNQEKIKALTKDKNIDVKYNEEKLGDILNAYLSCSLMGCFAKIRSLPTLRTAIYLWFRDYLGINPSGGEKSVIRVQAIILKSQNYEAFFTAIDKALKAYLPIKATENEEKSKENEVWNDTWEIPKEEFYALKMVTEFAYANSVQSPCYLENKRSDVEKGFEDLLAKKVKDKIQWFWKNKDFGQKYFGIKYKDEANETRTFYPDYLVLLTNGQLGIFDTKGGITAQTAKPKADALQTYIAAENTKEKNLVGGIIKLDTNGLWYINQNSNYQNHKKEDWKNLNDFWSKL
ncbi:MAG: hypothetical protein RLZZ292_892, partial [Bacteroidota bacterium]